MSTKNNPKASDCYAKALPDEPMFVLLARDPAAAHTIKSWIGHRRDLGVGYLTHDDGTPFTGKREVVKRGQAVELAGAMVAWRHASGNLDRVKQEKEYLANREETIEFLQAEVAKLQGIIAERRKIQMRQGAIIDTQQEKIAKLEQEKEKLLSSIRLSELAGTTRINQLLEANAAVEEARRKALAATECAIDQLSDVRSGAAPSAVVTRKQKKDRNIRILGVPFDRTPPNDKPLFWYNGKLVGKNFIRSIQESLEDNVPTKVVSENRWALYRGHRGFEALIDKGDEEQLISFCYQADKLIGEHLFPLG